MNKNNKQCKKCRGMFCCDDGRVKYCLYCRDAKIALRPDCIIDECKDAVLNMDLPYCSYHEHMLFGNLYEELGGA